MARVPGTVSQDIPSGEGEFIASILIPTPIFSQVATTVTTRVIRTNRRIENEKLNNSHWFNGIRAPSPSSRNWAFERCGGARKAAYSVERECGVPCQRSKAQSGATLQRPISCRGVNTCRRNTLIAAVGYFFRVPKGGPRSSYRPRARF